MSHSDHSAGKLPHSCVEMAHEGFQKKCSKSKCIMENITIVWQFIRCCFTLLYKYFSFVYCIWKQNQKCQRVRSLIVCHACLFSLDITQILISQMTLLNPRHWILQITQQTSFSRQYPSCFLIRVLRKN